LKVTREFKTGVAAIVIIAMFIWGYNFLKDRNLYDTSRTFFAEYSNVQGLAPKSPVTINGLKVGTVSEISFHPYKQGVLVVHLNITDDIQFSRKSVAHIYSPDFISGKSLKIEMAFDASDIAVSGDTISGQVDEGIIGMINEQIAPLQTKVESFVVQTDSVMKNIAVITSEENQKNIEASLRNISVILENFKKTSAYLEEMMEENGRFDSITQNASVAMENFSKISDSLQAADIGATVRRLQTSLESFQVILDSLNQGNGTIGKLMQDEELYDNLANASKELEELLREIKLHPKRFVHLSVFGKKEQPYTEPEGD
jgi:phospholipid/cholesterol/gamma-HCH transport system substrate-binding protein